MIHGSLDRLHFGDLLQWLQMGGVSGRLALVSRRGERRFDFQDGRVFFVSSTVPEERLGSWIAGRQLVARERLRRLLAASMLQRTLFTDLLLSEGELRAEDLGRAMTALAETLASRLLVTQGIEFRFDPDYPVQDVLGFNLNVQPSRLVMEAARRSDEAWQHEGAAVDRELPAEGEAFEGLFWQLVRRGVTAVEPLTGEELGELHDQVRDIVGALAQWLAHSPGLIPLPREQASRAGLAAAGGDRPSLFALPQAAWNQMVLSRSIHDPDHDGPASLHELERDAAEVGLWQELEHADHLQRPDAPKLDGAVQEVVTTWCRSAGAAAPFLGVASESAALAVHLVAVPTDLVLLVLATLPVPHRNLRTALLHHLPRRIGSCLARLGDFPPGIREILDPQRVTPLGVALQIGRERLAAPGPWPHTAPGGAEAHREVASPAILAAAAEAAREATEATTERD